MDEKKFTVKVFTTPGRPRSKRLRELGITAANISANNVINMNNSKVVEGHTHNNKSDIDAITIDRAGYLYITRPVFEAGPVAGTYDKKRVTEKVRAGVADLALDLAKDSPIWRRFLSRQEDDTAEGLISFLRGANFGEYAPGLTGFGGHIDDKGRAELESLLLRSFLEVPELRYNRVRVITGEEWNSKGGGIIESVDEENKSFQLKLEAGEHPAVAVGDICKLVYNTGAGFGTCYFRILSVSNDGVVRYALREGYDMHPKAMSHFVVYGNFFDTSRQASAYSTTSYTRYLKGVNDWEIGKHNIAMQFGDLSNLRVHGMQLDGYSAYLNNVYFTGTILQLSPEQIKEIADKVDSPYSVTLSSYGAAVVKGRGLKQAMRVTTRGKQVMTGDKEVTTTRNALETRVTVLKGAKELIYSSEVREGCYTVRLNAGGVKATVEYGNVVIADVGNGGHVDIEVNCEGKTVILQRYSVTVVNDGKDGQDGKYTETRYTYRNAQPDTPQGRHPEGWRVSQRRASEVVVEHGLNGFSADSEGVYTSVYHSQSTASIQYRSTEEIAVQYHLDGRSYGDTHMTVRITDGDRELYSKSYRGRYVDAPKVRMPISDNIRLTITATQSNNQDNYSWVKVSRIEGDKCWESKAVIDPAVHDIEGATESPQWSIPTLYRDYRETSTLTPTSLVIHRNSIGTLTPSQYLVANLNDKGDEVKTNLVLWTSSDGITWERSRIERNTAKMTITPTEGIKHYQVRKYKTLPDDVTYNHPYISSSTASLVEDGANGIGGVMPFLRGEYKVGETYTYDDKYRDIILYAVGGGDMLAYAVRIKGATVTAPPTAIGGDASWEPFSKFSLVATDTALINDAVIGGFAVWDGNLQSQRGRLHGQPIRLQDVPKAKRDKYRPNIAINGTDGGISALGSVVTPWQWGGGNLGDLHVIDDEATWQRFNGMMFGVYDYDNGKVFRLHNGHNKTFSFRAYLIIGRSNIGAYNETESTERYQVNVAIPPGAMFSAIVVPDMVTTADYRRRGVKVGTTVDGVFSEWDTVFALYPLCNMERVSDREYRVIHEVLRPRATVVAAGRVNAIGRPELKIGTFTSSSRDSLGAYTVYHSIGHTNYAPTVTARAQSGTLIAMIKNLTSTYFEVEISNDSGNYEDGAFNFSCTAEV